MHSGPHLISSVPLIRRVLPHACNINVTLRSVVGGGERSAKKASSVCEMELFHALLGNVRPPFPIPRDQPDESMAGTDWTD